MPGGKRATTATLAAALALALGCGGERGKGPASSAPLAGDRVTEHDGALARACRNAQRTANLRVLCPTWLPAGRGSSFVPRRLDLGDGSSAYLFELHPRTADDTRTAGHPFHVLFGGRARPLPLRTDGGWWPAVVPVGDELRLIGSRHLEPGSHGEMQPLRLEALRRTTVAGQRALLLRAAPSPDGGIHGGHYVLVWNAGGRGYALSMHFADHEAVGAPTGAELHALRRAADSMAPAE